MQFITLTKNELEIMELMWEIKRPLSRSEIIELSPNRSWKASSIHILLNKMLEKGAIGVEGFIRTGKNYGRTYSPLITEDDYFMMQLKQSSFYTNLKSSATSKIFSALLNDKDIDDNVIEELEQMIAERKNKKQK